MPSMRTASRLGQPVAVAGAAVVVATGPIWCIVTAAVAAAVGTALITSLALIATLSRRKYRRDAAQQVLRLLLVDTPRRGK
jgi:hypothetical protein